MDSSFFGLAAHGLGKNCHFCGEFSASLLGEVLVEFFFLEFSGLVIVVGQELEFQLPGATATDVLWQTWATETGQTWQGELFLCVAFAVFGIVVAWALYFFFGTAGTKGLGMM